MQSVADLLQVCRIPADMYAVCVKMSCCISCGSHAPVSIAQGIVHRHKGWPRQVAVAQSGGQGTQQCARLLHGVSNLCSLHYTACMMQQGYAAREVQAARHIHSQCNIHTQCNVMIHSDMIVAQLSTLVRQASMKNGNQ